MWNISDLFFLFFGALFIIKYLKVLWTSRSLPPGPVPLPLIGNLWTLNFQLHPERITQLSRLYGKIYTVWLGDSPLVVLNGWRAVKDGIASHSDELSGRPIASFLKDLLGGAGILTTSGHLWKQQRWFTLMTLRNLGLGKHGLESRIQDEAQCMIESFRAQKGAPFDPFNIISATVGNVISAVVYGHRFPLDDATYQELIKSNRGLLEGGGSAWAKNETKERVHVELDTVLDGSKLVCEVRKRLPYTNAVIHEIQRYANISDVGIPRTCVKEVNLYTYSLKKDTMVLANLDSVLFDPQSWKTHDQFNPNNFLDKDGNFLPNDAFLPFSGGARVYLGEQLARYELFIFFTTIMQSFRFHLPEGVTEVNTKYIYNLTLEQWFSTPLVP
ncbi:LOW QUALITY PROTEIN: cytochrome P450 2A9-like [Aquarana catesbeiana]|uniref:LOW QUALITY PROTEIN: cytochrome P450 2A9-like n=1 Tax=Aquarana catesbeiana TaxID=8400 RepID=UPI003CC9ACFE